MSVAAYQQLSVAASRLSRILADTEALAAGRWTPYAASELREQERIARDDLTAALSACTDASEPTPTDAPEPTPADAPRRRGRPPLRGQPPPPTAWDVQPAEKAERPAELVPVGRLRLHWRPDPAFGAWLQERRVAARMSSRAAAEVLGLAQPSLSRLECGETARVPPVARLLSLAERYGVAPQEMLHRAGFCVEVPMAEPDAEPDAVAQLSLKARAALCAFLETR